MPTTRSPSPPACGCAAGPRAGPAPAAQLFTARRGGHGVNRRSLALATGGAAAAAAVAIAVAAGYMPADAPPPDEPGGIGNGQADPQGPDGATAAQPDPKLGIIVNTPRSAVTLAELDAAYERAASAGAGRGNVYMFWNVLEPERDSYDWARYDTIMALHEKNGMRVTLYFSLINGRSLGPFPEWIGNPSLLSVPADHLVDAVGEVLGRYHIIDAVVIAGDADEHFRHRERDMPLYEDIFSEFYNATKEDHPGVAIGNAFSLNNALDKNLLGIVGRLSAGDFAAFTYRPTSPLNEINRTPEQARADLDRMLSIVPEGMPVALLEAGWATSPAVGGSQADQAEFAGVLYDYYVDNADSVEFVMWYRLYDRPAGTCEVGEEELGDAAASGLGNSTFVIGRLGDYVCSAGLLGVDGGEKAAWDRLAGRLRSGGSEPPPPPPPTLAVAPAASLPAGT